MSKPRTFRLALATVVLRFTLSGGSLWAHDSSMPFDDWMKSLVQPLYPASSCCGPADQF
jgi:hypothetical protein